MLIVQKFGGSSVADSNRLRNVANIVADTYKAGNDVIVTLSAQGDTTDDLIEKAKEINPTASRREMDMLLSTGEQISISLLAMALEKLDIPVVSLTGWQVDMQTDAHHSAARIKTIGQERLRVELDKKKVVVVAGFQGINKFGDITTLGRGGSDTTAVAIAAAMKADLCQIYTDVDGVYTADPRIVKDAKKLSDVSYDEMLELASLGANVLHNRSVEMAKKYNVELEVISSFNPIPGTKIKEVSNVEKMLVRGVTRDNDVAQIAVVGIADQPGAAFKLFSLLAKYNINVDIILQSIGRDNTKDISFTVAQDNVDIALKVINENLEHLGAIGVAHDTNISKVSIVGAGMASNAGVAAKMFEAVSDVGINIKMISTSEIKVSILIEEKDAQKAVNAIHDKFII